MEDTGDGRKKKKGRKVAKRKAKKRSEEEDLNNVTSMVRDMKSLGSDLAPPSAGEETRSQPASRRASVFELIDIPAEITRRDSVSPGVAENGGNRKIGTDKPDNINGRKQSTDKGSEIKRESVDDEIEVKKMKKILELMAKPQRDAQKSFTWDDVKEENEKESNRYQSKRSNKPSVTKEMAMKILGLTTGTNKTKTGVPKKLEDYSEEEVLDAFQAQCKALTSQGEMQQLQDTHEAYQVLVKVIRAKNEFIKKATEKRERNVKAAENAALAANVFKKKGLGQKLNIF